MPKITALPLLLSLVCGAALATPDVASGPDPDSHWRSEEPLVAIEGGVLHYDGTLNALGAERLRNVLAQADGPLSALHIASPGGDGLASIAIAEQIHAHELAVIVVGKGCISGCANYVFAPARSRTISPESLVLWHYSCPDRLPASRRQARMLLRKSYDTPTFSFRASSEDGAVTDPAQLHARFERELDKLADAAVTYARTMRAGHRRVYQGSGVDPRITCLVDHIRLPDAPNSSDGYLYTLSLADIQQFGLCDVQARPDYADWAARALAADADVGDRSGVVHLADHPRFRPRYRDGHCARVRAAAP